MKKALPYLITTAVGGIITIAIVFSKGIVSQTDVTVVMQILSDAFFVPGIILSGVGLLVFASNGGVFDMLAYATIMFFSLFKKNPRNRKYKDFYEYRQAKKEKKRGFAFMLIVGLAFIAVSVIFVICYYKV